MLDGGRPACESGIRRDDAFLDGGWAFGVDGIIRIVTQQPQLIVLERQPPLMTIPSLHATIAVPATMAGWRIPRFGPFFALFNLSWAPAIPLWGSRSFTDLTVRAAVAVAGHGAAVLLLPGRRWEAERSLR
ncbi:hypothetical protein [Dongia sp. agr-C8]